MTTFAYNGNPNLKRAGTTLEYDQALIEEYEKCLDDPVYFAEKYIKIVTVDKGLVPITLFDYQKELIESFKDNNRMILTTARQMGKCVGLNTKVKVRSKKTGKISEITMGELYNGNRNKGRKAPVDTETGM